MSASTTSVESSSTSSTDSKGTFLYFAFGSNLNSKRIHVNNPSAKRKGVGLLKNYRLDFNRYSERWKGSVATVVPDQDEEVWGALWEIDVKDMDNLDRQEGVERNIYRVFHPTIHVELNETAFHSETDSSFNNETSSDNETSSHNETVSSFNNETPPSVKTVTARCYELIAIDPPGSDKRPSVTYLDVVIKGALESQLPEKYVHKLRRIENNGQTSEYLIDRKVFL
uniref:gamma-glutamylcyclotransferase n=1 Tax=Cacopsylla melanoneura TaxID=428564 RepID=A0A8D8U4N5_9HEMI